MIGVFDSGLGGLRAFRALSDAFPSLDLLYYADTLHLPIGGRSEEEILALVERALSFFASQGVSHALLACGTASAVALKKCKAHFTFPIYGIIEEGARAACLSSASGHIAVIATPATIATHAYRDSILSLRPDATVTELPCPSLVTAAELGEDGAVREALSPLSGNDADTLILGCTHFPLLREAIEAFLPHMRTVDPAAVTVAALCARLSYGECAASAKRLFFTTGDPRIFSLRAAKVLGAPPAVRKV